MFDLTPVSAVRPRRRVVLADGATAWISAIRPSDAVALRAAFRRLSPESRYLRFQAYQQALPDHLWRYLTEVDGHGHVAIVAKVGVRIVGVARLVRVDDAADRAEVAFVVADDFQRRGLGRALRDALVVEAERRGIRSFRAHVLPENDGVRRLLSAPPLVLEGGGSGVVVAHLPVGAARRASAS